MNSQHKYEAGGLVDVFDIRQELYGLRNEFIEWNNDHLLKVVQNGEGPQHDKFVCDKCREHRAQIYAVERALRRFGGRPR